MLLALLGVYGVLVYSVSLRQQEFGIRIALGSGKAALMQLVLRQAAYPVLLGAAAGLTLAFLALTLGAQPLVSNIGRGPLGYRRKPGVASGGSGAGGRVARPPRCLG